MWVLATFDEDGKSWAMNMDHVETIGEKDGLLVFWAAGSNLPPDIPTSGIKTKASPATVIRLLMSSQASGAKTVRFHEGRVESVVMRTDQEAAQSSGGSLEIELKEVQQEQS